MHQTYRSFSSIFKTLTGHLSVVLLTEWFFTKCHKMMVFVDEFRPEIFKSESLYNNLNALGHRGVSVPNTILMSSSLQESTQ
jgi:hypothetical protein